jgi:hypothetical protein
MTPQEIIRRLWDLGHFHNPAHPTGVKLEDLPKLKLTDRSVSIAMASYQEFMAVDFDRFSAVHHNRPGVCDGDIGPASIDLLLVDGYDTSGIPAALSTQRFYNDCRAALRPGGVAAFNLYDTAHAEHRHRLQVAFGDANVAVVEEARQSNRVAFAWVGPLAATDVASALSPAGQRELRESLAAMRVRVQGR